MAPTDIVTEIDGAPVRLWIGRLYTDAEKEMVDHDVRVYVARIAVEEDAPLVVQTVLGHALEAMPAPRELPFYETLLPLRQIL